MNTINKVKPIGNKTQLCYLTFTYKNKDYQFLSNTPVLSGNELQKHVDGIAEQCLFSIHKQMYPDMPKLNTLEEIEHWIKDGCVIPAILDLEGNELEPERVAEKVEWTGKHPEDFEAQIDKAETIEDLKKIMKKMIKNNRN